MHQLQEKDDSQNSSVEMSHPSLCTRLNQTVSTAQPQTEEEQFHETVDLEGIQVKFQKANVRKTRTVLVSFSKHKLKRRGEVALTARYKDQVENVNFFVVDTEVESVLSGNSCLKLGLLKRVYHLTGQELPSKRVELTDYHIELAEGAVPVVHAQRKVPVPQRAKVVQELKRMEKPGVIVHQEQPTEWVK